MHSTNARSGCTTGTADRLERGEEAGFAVVGDHDRRGLVRAVDRDLLADVVGVRAVQSGRAHDDHRLGREVDVLLVLGDVARDRLVTELRELDPDLLGRDPVDAVADDRPRTARQRVALRGERDRGPPREHLAHRVGQLAQRGEDARAARCASAIASRRPSSARDARTRAGSRPRPARRTPSSTRRSSPRRDRRTCRARRRSCRRGRSGAGSRSRSPPRHARATRSTVRLVSVVVPDCEIATTSVSRMSASEPEARELGRGHRLDR